MAISGKPGLYKFISQGRNVMIVENLETGQRTTAFSTDKVIALADIAVFTSDDEVPLKDVLKAVFEKQDGSPGISHKSSPEDLKSWFAEILPNYDRERVYVSDIKKIANWYNIMQHLELLDFSENDDEKQDTGPDAVDPDVEKDKNGKDRPVAPKKKAPSKAKNTPKKDKN